MRFVPNFTFSFPLKHPVFSLTYTQSKLVLVLYSVGGGDPQQVKRCSLAAIQTAHAPKWKPAQRRFSELWNICRAPCFFTVFYFISIAQKICKRFTNDQNRLKKKKKSSKKCCPYQDPIKTQEFVITRHQPQVSLT